jgi:hypothetical protein
MLVSTTVLIPPRRTKFLRCYRKATFGIIIFLLWEYAAVLVAVSKSAAPVHVVMDVAVAHAIQD